MNTRSKKLADKFILLEKDIQLKFYKIAVILWKLKELNDSADNNARLLQEINDTKNFLISKLNTFKQLTLSGHIHQLSNKSEAKQQKHYIALLSYTNGDTRNINNIDVDQILKDNSRLEKENKELGKKIKELSGNLKKFLSPPELKKNDVKIYIRVLKNSKKIPTYEALELASNKTVSKSTWDRRLKSIPFLSQLISEIDKLIKRTKDEERRNFYLEDRIRLNDIFDEKLTQDFENKKTNSKIRFEDGKEKDILENIPDTRYYSSSVFDEAMEEYSHIKLTHKSKSP